MPRKPAPRAQKLSPSQVKAAKALASKHAAQQSDNGHSRAEPDYYSKVATAAAKGGVNRYDLHKLTGRDLKDFTPVDLMRAIAKRRGLTLKVGREECKGHDRKLVVYRFAKSA